MKHATQETLIRTGNGIYQSTGTVITEDDILKAAEEILELRALAISSTSVYSDLGVILDDAADISTILADSLIG